MFNLFLFFLNSIIFVYRLASVAYSVFILLSYMLFWYVVVLVAGRNLVGHRHRNTNIDNNKIHKYASPYRHPRPSKTNPPGERANIYTNNNIKKRPGISENQILTNAESPKQSKVFEHPRHSGLNRKSTDNGFSIPINDNWMKMSHKDDQNGDLETIDESSNNPHEDKRNSNTNDENSKFSRHYPRNNPRHMLSQDAMEDESLSNEHDNRVDISGYHPAMWQQHEDDKDTFVWKSKQLDDEITRQNEFSEDNEFISDLTQMHRRRGKSWKGHQDPIKRHTEPLQTTEIPELPEASKYGLERERKNPSYGNWGGILGRRIPEIPTGDSPSRYGNWKGIVENQYNQRKAINNEGDEKVDFSNRLYSEKYERIATSEQRESLDDKYAVASRKRLPPSESDTEVQFNNSPTDQHSLTAEPSEENPYGFWKKQLDKDSNLIGGVNHWANEYVNRIKPVKEYYEKGMPQNDKNLPMSKEYIDRISQDINDKEKHQQEKNHRDLINRFRHGDNDEENLQNIRNPPNDNIGPNANSLDNLYDKASTSNEQEVKSRASRKKFNHLDSWFNKNSENQQHKLTSKNNQNTSDFSKTGVPPIKSTKETPEEIPTDEVEKITNKSLNGTTSRNTKPGRSRIRMNQWKTDNEDGQDTKTTVNDEALDKTTVKSVTTTKDGRNFNVSAQVLEVNRVLI
ncbi:unnamed protein product [Owenia fusiformis]|uniref:Uncharacterized protein n=1 Tax=Owenia fusiformis TaxID=6347 RepID=A0A8S4PXT4_OWEFU|nr:unnamed protein product [Owenia fusiformis]